MANNSMKARQLPIYKTKGSNEAEKSSTPCSSGDCGQISEIRRTLWSYMDASKDTTNMIAEKCATASNHTRELYHFIRDDPGYLPRAGVIAIAGLGGLVCGYKGGVIRKSVYAMTGMGTAAAFCHPDQTLVILKQAYGTATDHVKTMWQKSGEGSSSKK
ncbi:MICOS complex subunit MIC27-like [Tubulanus polymorphus]|uniref:MICOS complex subunit MIC27-like n=1 Tax=Tubulanus polymorphus TaxID=672921 RepID=UPI003DA431BB